MRLMDGRQARMWMGTLLGCLMFSTVATGQTPAPSQPPKSTAIPFTPSDTTSALAHEAGDRGTMLSHLGEYPDITGSGPYPATYAMAPDGMEDVVYAPRDLSQIM